MIKKSFVIKVEKPEKLKEETRADQAIIKIMLYSFMNFWDSGLFEKKKKKPKSTNALL